MILIVLNCQHSGLVSLCVNVSRGGAEEMELIRLLQGQISKYLVLGLCSHVTGADVEWEQRFLQDTEKNKTRGSDL